MMRRSPLAFATLMIASFGLAACTNEDKPQETSIADNPTIYAVASAHPDATNAGLEILANGGNAVDAAIAVQAVLGLVEPQSSGLGGGAFMMLYDPKTGEIHSFDGRETAPASATPDMFLNDDGTPMPFRQAVISGKSVGVPSAIAMLAEVHAQYGSKEWGTLLAPARKLADEGFIVNERMSMLIPRYNLLDKVDPDAAAYFFDEAGNPRAPGSVLKNPAYVKTLDALAADPRHGLLSGEIGQSIVDKVNQITGEPTMTMEDLANYQPVERDPVCRPYRNYKVCSMGPPSSGAVTLLQILGLLEQTDFAQAEPNSVEAWHLYLEAVRLAYADRALYLADPDYMQLGNLGAPEIINGLLDRDYLGERATLIDPSKAIPSPQPGDFRAELGQDLPRFAADRSPEAVSTSHMSIIDADGMIVSMTTTVEDLFGSHAMASGFILNNQLTDFSFLPMRDGHKVANAVAPGKRPRSSMSPIIVFNETGEPVMAFGSPGGSRIITYVAKTLIGVVDWNMDLQSAIDMANIGAPYGTALVEENVFSQESANQLRQMGHEIIFREMTSGVYGFVKTEKGWQSGADRRKPGTAIIVTQKTD